MKSLFRRPAQLQSSASEVTTTLVTSIYIHLAYPLSEEENLALQADGEYGVK